MLRYSKTTNTLVYKMVYRAVASGCKLLKVFTFFHRWEIRFWMVWSYWREIIPSRFQCLTNIQIQNLLPELNLEGWQNFYLKVDYLPIPKCLNRTERKSLLSVLLQVVYFSFAIKKFYFISTFDILALQSTGECNLGKEHYVGPKRINGWPKINHLYYWSIR